MKTYTVTVSRQDVRRSTSGDIPYIVQGHNITPTQAADMVKERYYQNCDTSALRFEVQQHTPLYADDINDLAVDIVTRVLNELERRDVAYRTDEMLADTEQCNDKLDRIADAVEKILRGGQ